MTNEHCVFGELIVKTLFKIPGICECDQSGVHGDEFPDRRHPEPTAQGHALFPGKIPMDDNREQCRRNPEIRHRYRSRARSHPLWSITSCD